MNEMERKKVVKELLPKYSTEELNIEIDRSFEFLFERLIKCIKNKKRLKKLKIATIPELKREINRKHIELVKNTYLPRAEKE